MNNRSRTLKLVTALLLLAGCLNGQNKSEEREIGNGTIPEFKIEFPQTDFEVEKSETRDFSSTENLLVTNWILQGETEDGPFMYYVTHHKFPTEINTAIKEDSTSLIEFFKAAMISSATRLGGENFRFIPYTYDKYHGLESICDVFNKNGVIKSRMIKIENDVFVICAGGRKVSMETVDKFLNSFSLKK